MESALESLIEAHGKDQDVTFKRMFTRVGWVEFDCEEVGFLDESTWVNLKIID